MMPDSRPFETVRIAACSRAVIVQRAIRLLVCAILWAPALASAADARDVWTDPPLPEIHWGEYRSSPGTRMIFISSSEGDDRTARPNSMLHPYRTIEAAMLRVQSGYPDWILLKCGDTFDEGWNDDRRWRHSGRNADEPMIVGSYGSGPRPRITGLRSLNGPKGPDQFMSHIVFYGIHFTEPVDIRTGGENIVFEDCYFEQCPLLIQGLGPQHNVPAMHDVIVRRCVFDNNFSRGGRPQNLFVNLVNGLTIEGCFFNRGGWNPDVEGARASVHNHNVYIQYRCENIIFRGNISVDASSHGAQIRPGGIVEGNLFIRNPIALTFGATSNRDYPDRSASGVIRYNLVLDSRDIDDQPRGHGIWIDNAGPVDVHHNIIAHQRGGSASAAFIVGTAYHDVRIRDNIIYGWVALRRPESGRAFLLSGVAGGENRIERNIVAANRGGRIVDDRTGSPAWHLGEIETDGDADFVDPTRDLDRYLESIGIEGGFDAFVERCLRQRKRTWDHRFTADAVIRWVFAGFQTK